MSDKPPRNDEDYDTLYPDSGKIIDAEEVVAFSDDKKDFDARDYDDEEGIFAPDEPYQKSSKKSSGLWGAALLVGVLAAGGYVVYSNPSIINQIKNNFNITDTVSVAIPEELNVAASLPTAPTAAPEQNDAMNEALIEMPLPDAAMGNGNAVMPPINPDDALTASPETPPATDAIANYSLDQSVPPSSPPYSAVPPVEVAADTTTSSETPPPVSIAETTSAPTPDPDPVSEQAALKELSPQPTDATTPITPLPETASVDAPITPPADVVSVPDVPQPATEKTAEQPALLLPPVVATTTPTPVSTPLSAPSKSEEEKAETPKPAIKRADVFQSGAKPIVVQSEEEKQALANAKLNTYFDAPKGKVLQDMPTPSLNTKRGNNESIIVVTKQVPKKTVSSSASSSSKQKLTRPRDDYNTPSSRVSVETNSLDNKATAASRALKLGRYDAAQTMYDELYRLNPRDGKVLMGRAVLFQKTGQTERAISAYEEVLRVDPNNAEALVNVAGLVRKQYPAVALSKLLDLHQQYPNNPYVTAQLGVTYADSGNVQDAYRYLSQAASQEPNNPKHYFNMAVVADRAGNTAKAVQYYERALEVDAMHGDGRSISREKIYDRLSMLRGQ